MVPERVEGNRGEEWNEAVSCFVPLKELPHELILQIVKMLDEKSLLRLSEVDKYMYAELVKSHLFQPDICVHCNAQFTTLDNRNIKACIPIRNKLHRKHKGKRAANQRELRRMQDLVDQRFRIARGHQFLLDDDSKETCAICQKQYLGYQVSDDAWLSNVPRHYRDLCLCMSCYLGSKRNNYRLIFFVVLLVAFVTIYFKFTK